MITELFDDKNTVVALLADEMSVKIFQKDKKVVPTLFTKRN